MSDFKDRRTGTDRRSNWNEALSRLKLQDDFLVELDNLLKDMQEEGKLGEEEEQIFDSDLSYWADRLATLRLQYKR